MNQTRLGSLIEAFFNIVIGYWINFLGNMLILPLFGFHITLSQNLQIGLLFTVISVARSYLVRRYFNDRLQKLSQRLANNAQ
jgi:membrane protein implicated in regulation of membrane protease activity